MSALRRVPMVFRVSDTDVTKTLTEARMSGIRGVDALLVWLVFVVVLDFGRPSVISAQEASLLVTGARIRARVAPSGRHHTGTVVALRNDTLTLHRGGSAGPIALPLTGITQLERSLGPGRCRSAGARLECVVLGTLAGAVVGGVVSYQATRCTDCDSSGIGVLLGVPAGTVIGLLVGAYVGGERWERLPVPGSTGGL